jgi:hypothetical protein
MSAKLLSQVEELAMQLTPDEQLLLVERLAQHVRLNPPASPPKQVVSLRDKFRTPQTDAITYDDVDRALREIRSEWLVELDEVDETGEVK